MDLRGAWERLPAYEVVYSLGVIEHFEDLTLILREHWRLVKPGGYLILGVPHFMHVFWPLLRRFAPRITAGHFRPSLKPSGWCYLDGAPQVQRLFTGYWGGFEPTLMCSVLEDEWSWMESSASPAALALFRSLRFWMRLRYYARWLCPAINRLPRWNSSLWSSYAMGVYRKVGDSEDVSQAH